MRLVRLLLSAAFLAAPASVAAQTFEAPTEPPPESNGPVRSGFIIGLDIGFGACPDCPYSEAGVTLGGRLGYRLPMGLAFSGYIESLNGGRDRCGGDYYYYDYYDGEDCFSEELVLILFGGEVRYHPLSRFATAFDPYVALGVGYGVGASRFGGPDLAEYSGFVLLPRIGAMATLSNTIALGGYISRTFAFWSQTCDDDGELLGPGFTCEDLPSNEPEAWLTALEVTFRF